MNKLMKYLIVFTTLITLTGVATADANTFSDGTTVNWLADSQNIDLQIESEDFNSENDWTHVDLTVYNNDASTTIIDNERYEVESQSEGAMGILHSLTVNFDNSVRDYDVEGMNYTVTLEGVQAQSTENYTVNKDIGSFERTNPEYITFNQPSDATVLEYEDTSENVTFDFTVNWDNVYSKNDHGEYTLSNRLDGFKLFDDKTVVADGTNGTETYTVTKNVSELQSMGVTEGSQVDWTVDIYTSSGLDVLHDESNFAYEEAISDTTPPSITDINVEAEGDDQKVTNGENITVSANISDNESGVQNARLFWEFQEVGTTYKMTDEDGDGIYSVTIQADNGEAPDTFKIDAVDNEGNRDDVAQISNPISFEQPDLITSFVVDQRVDGTIEETVNLMPDYDYNDGTVTYYYEKRVVVRNNQTIDEGNWERIDFNSSTDGTQEVSKDILVGIDRVAERTGEYSVRKEIFKANATYNWDEDGDGILDTDQGWSSYDTERVDTVSYEFEVASADEPFSPVDALGSFFDSIIDGITSSITDLFDEEPTAVPQPNNPPTPSNQ